MTGSPVNIDSLHEKAGHLLQLHRLTEARPLYVEICETVPNDADAWLMLGAIDEQLGLLDDAQEYLQNAIAYAPEMAEAYLTLANILWRKGEVMPAIDVVYQSCKQAPEYAEAWLRLGRMQLDIGNTDALDSLTQAGALSPEADGLGHAIIEALVASKQFDTALQNCDSLPDEQGDYWLAYVLLANGELDSACRAFSQVSMNSPWYIPARWQVNHLSRKNVSPELLREYVQWHFDQKAAVYDFYFESRAEAFSRQIPIKLIHQHLASDSSLLDLGCGTGNVGRLLRRKGDFLFGIDLSRQMLDRASQQGSYDVLNHADLSCHVCDGSYDLVILADVLQWCDDPQWTLKMASQAVARSGLILVTNDAESIDEQDALHSLTTVKDAVAALVNGDDFDVLFSTNGPQSIWLLGQEAMKTLAAHDEATPQLCSREQGLDELQAGMIAFAGQDFSQASDHYLESLQVNPVSSETLLQMGLLDQQQESFDTAIEYYQRILETEPNNITSLFQIGVIHQIKEDYQDAVDVYQQAAKKGAKLWMLYNNLGWVLQKQGHIEEARRAYLTALYHDPVSHTVLSNLQLLEDEDDGRQPRDQLELTLEDAAGNDAGMLLGFAAALREREFFQRALILIRRAMELKLDFHDAKMQLALTLQKTGEVAEAIEVYKELLDEHPNKAGVYDNLAGATASCDDMEKACLLWEKGCQQTDISAGTHSNRLFMYNYSPQAGREILSSVHLGWGQVLEQSVKPIAEKNPDVEAKDRRLRIGYVSTDFYGHSVSHFLEPVLASHNHDAFEIFCYANNDKEDPMTTRLRYYADHWQRINGQDDDAVVQRIRDDGIDILVDLTGHTGGSRLPVFAHKPAPVQVTWLGYPNTTGLSRIDYRLTDGWADPPGMTETLHSEKLFRLPQSFLCYRPNEFAPAIEVSRERRSVFTFGCFNNLYKLSPEVVRVWSRILKAMPESTLLLKSFGFNADCVYQRYTRLFTEQGIDPQRVHMMGRLGTREHLDLYNRMDIVLDPFPYNGTTTTCEALWMGVPVIALAGDRHAARVSVSLLSVMGCEELIAIDEDEYVQKAVELARDSARLENYKAELRRRMKNSPLTDRTGFTDQLETSYRQMWKIWCEKDSNLPVSS